MDFKVFSDKDVLDLHQSIQRVEYRRKVIRNVILTVMGSSGTHTDLYHQKEKERLNFSVVILLHLEAVTGYKMVASLDSRSCKLSVSDGGKDAVMLFNLTLHNGICDYQEPPRQLVDPIFRALPELLSKVCLQSEGARQEVDFWSKVAV